MTPKEPLLPTPIPDEEAGLNGEIARVYAITYAAKLKDESLRIRNTSEIQRDDVDTHSNTAAADGA